uniref:Uncharacterized protein n=1 Tax=Globodera pallida TaxID=36090 RepID=A0A183C5B1_GLOPA
MWEKGKSLKQRGTRWWPARPGNGIASSHRPLIEGGLIEAEEAKGMGWIARAGHRRHIRGRRYEVPRPPPCLPIHFSTYSFSKGKKRRSQVPEQRRTHKTMKMSECE